MAEFYDFALTRRSFSAALGIDGFASRRQIRDPTSATSDGGYTETDAAWEDAGLFRRAHACHASALQRLKASLAYEGRPREDFRTRPSSLWPPSFGPDGGQRPPLRREVSNSGTRVCAREHIHRAKEPAARLSVRYWQDEYVRTKRRMHALNRARMLARSGSHTDHVSIAELASSGLRSTRGSMTPRFCAQLDKLCTLAKESRRFSPDLLPRGCCSSCCRGNVERSGGRRRGGRAMAGTTKGPASLRTDGAAFFAERQGVSGRALQVEAYACPAGCPASKKRGPKPPCPLKPLWRAAAVRSRAREGTRRAARRAHRVPSDPAS